MMAYFQLGLGESLTISPSPLSPKKGYEASAEVVEAESG